MRILFISGLYPPHTRGGAELSAHYVAQGLQQRGHTVQVLAEAPEKAGDDIVDRVLVRRAVLGLTKKPLFERRWARKVATQLAAEMALLGSFDIIHCHDFRAAQVVGMMKLPKAVVTIRDYAFICGSPNNILADGSLCPGCEKLSVVLKNRAVVEAPLLRRPFRVWQYWHNIEFRKKSLRAINNRIFISKAQKDIITKRLPLSDGQETVIYNPVPPSYFAERPVRVVGKTILFVGTLESYKGVGFLLEAFARLRKKMPDVQLKIVGEGAQRSMYERFVARHGLQYHVTFAGRLPYERLRIIYDEALVVVSPHVWPEPFGRTVVEAMARERIVVAARQGGPAEILKDGVTGILFDPNSVRSLEEALARALRMAEIDKRQMQQAARQWVALHLTLDTIAAAHESFYRQVITAMV